MKKIIIALFITLIGIPNNIVAYGGHSGGAIAGGVLGGIALGSLLASRPRRTEREVVYVDRPVYVDKYGNPTSSTTSSQSSIYEENDDLANEEFDESEYE